MSDEAGGSARQVEDTLKSHGLPGPSLELNGAAEHFRRSGFSAARSGRLDKARRLLETAVQLEPVDAQPWAVLGLCAFASGDVAEARRSWKASTARDAESPAAAFLELVESGAGRDALEAYNEALHHAKGERWRQARSCLQQAREALPDFVPAAILLGLVHEAEGKTAAARRVWARASDRYRDHPELLRLLGLSTPGLGRTASQPRSYWPYAAVLAAAVGLVWVSVVSQTRDGGEPPGEVAQAQSGLNRTTPPVDTPEEDSSQVLDRSDVSMAVISGGAPDAGVLAVQYDVAWGLFEQARDRSAMGDWAGAVPRLVLVDELAPGRFYHDDALYLLARGYAIRGRSDEAKAVADVLLTKYPESIFANSVTRAIAETGQHP